MSLVPPEILCLLASAFLAKSFNRTPPLWERLLAGLRYYDTPYKSDVERVLAAAVAQDVAPVRGVLGRRPQVARCLRFLWGEPRVGATHDSCVPAHPVLPPPVQFAPGRDATLAQLAGDAVDTRGRLITYSYFPIQTVPWGSMIARDALTSLAVSAVYAALAGGMILTWVRARAGRGRPCMAGTDGSEPEPDSSPARASAPSTPSLQETLTGATQSLHSDLVTVVALATALLACGSHLRRLGLSNTEVRGRAALLLCIAVVRASLLRSLLTQSYHHLADTTPPPRPHIAGAPGAGRGRRHVCGRARVPPPAAGGAGLVAAGRAPGVAPAAAGGGARTGGGG